MKRGAKRAWATWQGLCLRLGEWVLRAFPWLRAPAERAVEGLYRAERRFGRRWLWVASLWVVLASAALLLALGAPTASATPGGLDRAGGHHCWTRCSSYGKRTGQYHCHRSMRACKKALRQHRRHGH